MSVFGEDTDIERIVAIGLQRNRLIERDAEAIIDIGQPVDHQFAIKSTEREAQRLVTDVGYRDIELALRRLDLEPAGIGLAQRGVEAREIAGRDRTP